MNPARKPFIAGNWKMYKGGAAGVELASGCAQLARKFSNIDLLVAPPFTALAACAHDSEDSGLLVAGQNMHAAKEGAFTGEISPAMLKECGAEWVILGHSERRQLFGDSDDVVAAKMVAAYANELSPIICVGETLQEREANKTLDVVRRQLNAVLDIVAANPGHPTCIAYEPVWAIGTGKTAGPAEAEQVHQALRGWLSEKSPKLALQTRVLYGGSVKPDNAKALLACPNVDGALIGGASLELSSFGAIAQSASEGFAALS